jgi:CheY-like chemotaxis protein
MELDTKRVLRVDDDLSTLKVRKFLLDAAGYAVVTASSGTEAFDAGRDLSVK